MRSNLLPVLKEGWIYIFWALGFFVLFTLLECTLLQFLTFFAILGFVYLYRNPEREFPMFQDASVTSPVDGIVLSIEEIEDKEYGYKVVIESDFSDVAVFRAPISGSTLLMQHTKGTRLSKHDALFAKTNENAVIVFETTGQNKVKVVHTSKQNFSGINVNIIQTQNVVQTLRYGSMINGITTMYLPKNFRLDINTSTQVTGSETLIGYFS